MKPHKHAELIKAWADGARIQCLSQPFNEWIDVNHNPSWRDDREYRIKPEPKPDIDIFIAFDGIYARDCVVNPTNAYYWSNKVMLTFDGETGKLKSAEVIK